MHSRYRAMLLVAAVCATVGCTKQVLFRSSDVKVPPTASAREALVKYLNPGGLHAPLINRSHAMKQTVTFAGVKEFPARRQVAFLWTWKSRSHNNCEVITAFQFPVKTPPKIMERGGRYMVVAEFEQFISDQGCNGYKATGVELEANEVDFPSGLSMYANCKQESGCTGSFSIFNFSSRRHALDALGALCGAMRQYDPAICRY